MMLEAGSSASVVALVRERDRDRYIATLWAPARARAGLFALHALDLELLQVVRTTTEPMLGQIRLAWWRERLEALDRGEVPAQPVLQALAAHVLPHGVAGAGLTALEDGMLTLLDRKPDGALHARKRGATLFEAAAVLLGGAGPAAAGLGQAWAWGELRRLGEPPVVGIMLPPSPYRLRSLRALAMLGRDDIRTDPPEPRGSPRRQRLIARTMLFGR